MSFFSATKTEVESSEVAEIFGDDTKVPERVM